MCGAILTPEVTRNEGSLVSASSPAYVYAFVCVYVCVRACVRARFWELDYVRGLEHARMICVGIRVHTRVSTSVRLKMCLRARIDIICTVA